MLKAGQRRYECIRLRRRDGSSTGRRILKAGQRYECIRLRRQL